MKLLKHSRVFAVLVAFVMCLNLAAPAMAVDDGFTEQDPITGVVTTPEKDDGNKGGLPELPDGPGDHEASDKDTTKNPDHCSHELGDWTTTTEPTCTEKGSKTRTCPCGQNSETEDIPALGHDWGEWEDNGDGTHSQVCKRDPSHTEGTADHTYGGWTTTKTPTADEPGEQERTCTDCGHVDTQAIPATGPQQPEDPDEPEEPENPDPDEPDEPDEPEQPTVPDDDDEDDDEDDTPVVDIPDDDVPLTDLPDDGSEVDVPDVDVPLTDLPDGGDDDVVDVPDDDVPLADLPDDGGDVVDVPDDDVPLGDVPQTGEASTVLWMMAVAAAGAGLVYVNTGRRREDAQ